MARIEAAVFKNRGEVDARTTVLVGLAQATGLLGVNFDKKKLKEHKARIQQIANGEVVGQATKEAVEAAQAAIMLAAVMPAITTSVIVSTTSS